MALDLTADALLSTVSPTTNTAADTSAPSLRSLAGSQTLTGLEVRLSRVFIKDNHTARVGPFPGRANLYLLVAVTDGRPLTDDQVTLTGFPGINDQEELLIDRTVYFWEPGPTAETAPSQVHVLVSVLKSKQRLRDTGTLLTQAQASAPYQSLAARLAGGALTVAGQAPNLLLRLGSEVAKLLTEAEDKTLLTQVTSFTDLNGDFDALGHTDHAQENGSVATTLTLIVRDAGRSPAVASS
ncbi:hypothetical protein [Hymenobacter lucidus]|uniref:Uncharacterized protein n=1 Tax=Hymenobacter lucidus TaxID=2880930 RepID=A0ABS8AMU9_9BACT|nr:hypothetical protein [Hymenobacter lucidus]MCB2407444.1 hypothetical protein [Hymenobacter lucidus]